MFNVFKLENRTIFYGVLLMEKKITWIFNRHRRTKETGDGLRR